ncbi:NAD(P)/FAD-dependent oxidoreductase [Colwellia psychrerythraea]|uniref:D-amino-acid dehydrogenase n=1 Tax=Colwellia psychrerythraea TaxID=28229 RepID=A0A099L479_COLPS|nr:FAD-dependent oxidoreductase [Colwellia psychrerythraea]KGJ96962.1 D-amino-acid dehydrogenase [Colwellia psychrerythraea]
MNTATNKQQNKKQQTVAVIGAGIIGINCALELQSLGYQVTLLDKEGIGLGCSKGNAGHFATEQVFPLAESSLLWQMPKLLLDPLGPVSLSAKHFIKAIPWFMQFFNNMRPSLRDKNTVAIKALNKDAISHYNAVLKEANIDHLITLQGSLLVFETTDYNKVDAMYQHYKNEGVAVKLLDRAETIKLEPNLNDNINYSLFFTDVAHTVDPLALSVALSEFAKSKGMTFQQSVVTEITQAETGVTVLTDLGSLTVDHCVVACGAWSKELLKGLSYHLPIEAERGYSLSLPLPNNTNPTLSRPVASAERRFIITPMDNTLRLAGTVEYAGLNAPANYKRAEMLKDNAAFILKTLPEQETEQKSEQESWMGCRPSLPDSLPVICQAPNHDKIFFALGHQHLGLTQGAITGKLIGQLVTKKKTEIDVSPFCISRFNKY